MKNLAIFASGEGTNAQQLINYFKDSNVARVALVVSNNGMANVINRAKKSEIPVQLLDKNKFRETTELLEELKKKQIDFIVLAGFLWLIPTYLTQAFPGKIVNIHPALLPKYGGKGMYGANVHKAVIAAQEKESGITIHYVNEKYDEGKIILQERCPLSPVDTPETLADKVHQLEHTFFALTIEKILRDV